MGVRASARGRRESSAVSFPRQPRHWPSPEAALTRKNQQNLPGFARTGRVDSPQYRPGFRHAPNHLAPDHVLIKRGHSLPEGSGMEMKTTRRYAAGLAAVVTTAAGLLAGLAGSASAGGFPAFVGP